MQTVLHCYNFDVREPAEKAAWKELKAKLSTGPACHGPVLANVYSTVKALDGVSVDLETTHLFENQWNTAPIAGVSESGLRVFDWALEALPNNRFLYRGHYLDQTAEMREVRRNTNKCGYCGHQESAAKGLGFCDRCRDSQYLTEIDLHLTRMRAIDDRSDSFPKLTDAERNHLLPLFRAAQIHGSTARGAVRIASERLKMAENRDKAIANANAEFDGKTWLMDRGINTDNVIYYGHTGRFGFGWRKPYDAGLLASLLEAMGAEFPFPYDIVCADGRVLSGN